MTNEAHQARVARELAERKALEPPADLVATWAEVPVNKLGRPIHCACMHPSDDTVTMCFVECYHRVLTQEQYRHPREHEAMTDSIRPLTDAERDAAMHGRRLADTIARALLDFRLLTGVTMHASLRRGLPEDQPRVEDEIAMPATDGKIFPPG